MLAKGARDGSEQQVALGVTFGVVDALEPVDVQGHHRDHAAVAVGQPLERGRRGLVEGATVREAGERVEVREPLEGLDVQGARDRAGEDRRQGLEVRRVRRGELRLEDAARGVQLAPQAAVHHDRGGHRGRLGERSEQRDLLGVRSGVRDRGGPGAEVPDDAAQLGEVRELIHLVLRPPHLVRPEQAGVDDGPQGSRAGLDPADRDAGCAQGPQGLLGSDLEHRQQPLGAAQGAGHRGEAVDAGIHELDLRHALHLGSPCSSAPVACRDEWPPHQHRRPRNGP